MPKQYCYVSMWYDDTWPKMPWYATIEVYNPATMKFEIRWKSRQFRSRDDARDWGVEQAGLSGYILTDGQKELLHA